MDDSSFTNSLCWKIEGGPGRTSYVFGSIHQMDTSKIELPLPELTQLLDKTQALCIEVELGDSNAAEGIGQSMSHSGNKSHDLAQLLGAKYMGKLRNILENSSLGKELLPMLGRMPLPLTALMVTAEKQQQSELFSEVDFEIEKHFADLAEKRGYPIHALETIDEQMALLAQDKPVAEQIQTLKQAIDNYNDPNMPDMFKRYTAQDLRLLRAEDFSAPEMTERNALLTNRLGQLLGEKSLLIIVGAAHLPFETGILALLQKQGYSVTPQTIHLAPKPG